MSGNNGAIGKIKNTVYCVLHPWEHNRYIDPKSHLIKKIFLYSVTYSAYALLWAPPFTPIPAISLFADLWKKYNIKQTTNDTETKNKTEENYNKNKPEKTAEEIKKSKIETLKKDAIESNNKLLGEALKKVKNSEIHQKMEEDIKELCKTNKNQIDITNDESLLNKIKNKTIDSEISEIEKIRKQKAEEIKPKIPVKKTELEKELETLSKEIKGWELDFYNKFLTEELKVQLNDVGRRVDISIAELDDLIKKQTNSYKERIQLIREEIKQARKECKEVYKKYSPEGNGINFLSVLANQALDVEFKKLVTLLRKSVFIQKEDDLKSLRDAFINEARDSLANENKEGLINESKKIFNSIQNEITDSIDDDENKSFLENLKLLSKRVEGFAAIQNIVNMMIHFQGAKLANFKVKLIEYLKSSLNDSFKIDKDKKRKSFVKYDEEKNKIKHELNNKSKQLSSFLESEKLDQKKVRKLQLEVNRNLLSAKFFEEKEIIEAINDIVKEKHAQLVIDAKAMKNNGTISQEMLDDLSQIFDLAPEMISSITDLTTIDQLIDLIEKKKDDLANELRGMLEDKKEELDKKKKDSKKKLFINEVVEELTGIKIKNCYNDLNTPSLSKLIKWKTVLKTLLEDLEEAINKAQNDYVEIVRKHAPNGEDSSPDTYTKSIEPELEKVLDQLKTSLPEIVANGDQYLIKTGKELYQKALNLLREEHLKNERKKTQDSINKKQEEVKNDSFLNEDYRKYVDDHLQLLLEEIKGSSIEEVKEIQKLILSNAVGFSDKIKKYLIEKIIQDKDAHDLVYDEQLNKKINSLLLDLQGKNIEDAKKIKIRLLEIHLVYSQRKTIKNYFENVVKKIKEKYFKVWNENYHLVPERIKFGTLNQAMQSDLNAIKNDFDQFIVEYPKFLEGMENLNDINTVIDRIVEIREQKAAEIKERIDRSNKDFAKTQLIKDLVKEKLSTKSKIDLEKTEKKDGFSLLDLKKVENILDEITPDIEKAVNNMQNQFIEIVKRYSPTGSEELSLNDRNNLTKELEPEFDKLEEIIPEFKKIRGIQTTLGMFIAEVLNKLKLEYLLKKEKEIEENITKKTNEISTSKLVEKKKEYLINHLNFFEKTIKNRHIEIKKLLKLDEIIQNDLNDLEKQIELYLMEKLEKNKSEDIFKDKELDEEMNKEDKELNEKIDQLILELKTNNDESKNHFLKIHEYFSKNNIDIKNYFTNK